MLKAAYEMPGKCRLHMTTTPCGYMVSGDRRWGLQLITYVYATPADFGIAISLRFITGTVTIS